MTKAPPSVGVVSLGCPKNLVDTEVMLGHLQRAGHAHRAGRRGPRRPRQHVRLHRPRRRKSRSRRSSSRSSARSGARSTASSSPGAWSRSTAGELSRGDPGGGRLRRPRRARERAPRRPRAFRRFRASPTSRSRHASTTSSRRACCRAAGATRTSRSARAATTPARSARSRRCAGSSAAGRSSRSSPRRESLEAQGVSELVLDLAGHDPLRRGPRHGPGGPRAARRGARSPGRPFRGSAFSTRIRRRSTIRSSTLMAREPRFVALRRHPAPARRAADPRRRCAAAATRRPTSRMIERMRADRAGDRHPHDLHRGLSRGRARPSFRSCVEFVRDAEFDNLGAFTYSPEPGSGSEPLGDPVPAEEKERRKDFLLSLQQPIARAKLRGLRGRDGRGDRRGPVGGVRVPARGPPALAGPRDRRASPDHRRRGPDAVPGRHRAREGREDVRLRRDGRRRRMTPSADL